MPLMLAELTMKVRAPASAAALNGVKYFSRIICGDRYAGVRSLPVKGAP